MPITEKDISALIFKLLDKLEQKSEKLTNKLTNKFVLYQIGWCYYYSIGIGWDNAKAFESFYLSASAKIQSHLHAPPSPRALLHALRRRLLRLANSVALRVSFTRRPFLSFSTKLFSTGVQLRRREGNPAVSACPIIRSRSRCCDRLVVQSLLRVRICSAE